MAELMARSHLLCGGDVLTPTGWQEFDLNVVDGVIRDESTGQSEVLDVSGLKIVPGYIDLQVNGGWGHDLGRDPASIWPLSERLVEIGVTSFLPTLTTNGYSRRREALSLWQAGPVDSEGHRGADPIGWHFEGPWLAPSRHGAHSRELLQPVPRAAPADYTPDLGLRLVTLAPELNGALPMIAELKRHGVVVACGHSEATSAQAVAGFESGITIGTHLFNAMSGLNHREVGLAAALLLTDSTFVTMIIDGEHVDPDMVKLAWRLASHRLIAISDAVAFMGTAAASATGSALRLYDGTLAGSTIGVDAAVRNLMSFTGCDLADAVSAASLVPARSLGLSDRGRIEVGCRADLVGLDDEANVVLTMVAGDLVWDRR
ncbi:MAG: N-acetylglucosamine-6-phosphate deacetylase [Actinomycetia bacterium]|nr:N-acetylglucosamine-6-phosphate deacetylase [Actinomycetes bacterium]MCP5033890.1 N-acetylglucosamine-6-phosphate deacetylase [Actinomycetes bacterium]